MKSLWRTVRYSTWKDFSLLADFWLRTAFAGGQFLADFRRKKVDFSALELWPLKTELVTSDLSDFPGLPAENGLRREKTYSTCFDWLFAIAGWKCIQTARKEKTKDKNLLDNPKEEKTRFGLVGRKVYRKVFSTFDLLILKEFSRTRQEIHKTCFETLILRVWILKIIR